MIDNEFEAICRYRIRASATQPNRDLDHLDGVGVLRQFLGFRW